MPEPIKQRDPVYGDGRRAVTKPDLRAQEGINSNTAGRESGGATSSTGAQDGGATSSTDGGLYSDSDNTKRNLNDAEESGAGSAQSSEDGNENGESSLYNPSGDNQGRLARGRNRLRNARGRLSNLSKSKLVVAGTASGGIIVLLLLFILLSSLKLPQLSQNIENYEFARVTSQFSKNAQRVSDESLAVEASNDSTFSAWKAKFTGPFSSLYGNIRDTTWGRLDAYRPSQVIKTLGNDHNLQLHFQSTGLGRQRFTGVTLDNEFFAVKQVTGVSRFVPGLNKLLVANNKLNFYQGDFMPTLLNTMQTDGTATLVRGAVANNILQITGGNRAGWILSKFAGLNSTDARIEASVEMYSATQKGATFSDNAKTSEISQADSAATNATSQAVSSWSPSSTSSTPIGTGGSTTSTPVPSGGASSSTSTLPATISTGNDEPALAAADSALSPSLFKSVLGVADPVYAIFTPICIIYDGSVQQSGPIIDNQTNQQENAFDQLAAEADQQKKGDQTSSDAGELSTAISGTNAEVGNYTTSVPYQRASGTTISTADIQSAEAGADGSFNFSLLNAIGLSPSSFAGKSANWITGNLCSSLTSTYTAGALSLANIVAAVLSFGGTEAGEEAAGQGAIQFTKTFVQNTVSNIFSRQTVTNGTSVIERSALNRAQRFTFKQGVIVGGTYGLTELAHMVVAARSGSANNGLAQNNDLVNEADSGANIEAGQWEQKQLFGRPMTNPEVGQDDKITAQWAYAQNASKSFSQRYFALDNPDSLFSHLALDLSGNDSRSLFGSATKLSASILRPLSYVGSLLSFSGLAHATPNPATQHYGNIQFGWSQAEEDLIDSSSTYKPLENQQILDKQNSQEVQIAMKYAVCFGYKYDSSGNGDLDPTDTGGDLQLDPSATLGSLLSSGNITRDSNGNITNDGLCAPDNLSYDNTSDSSASDTDSDSPKPNDLVFRWRLAMSYDTTLDQLINEQSITSSTGTPSTGPAPAGGLPTGSAQALAKQIQPYISSGKITCNLLNSPYDQHCSDITNTGNGVSIKGGEGCEVDALSPSLLGMMLELLQLGHTFGLSALCSDHHDDGATLHAGGHAADFATIDGVAMNQSVPWSGAELTAGENFDRDIASFMPKSTQFNQTQCHKTFDFLNGFDTSDQTDSCTHQHITAGT